MENFLAFSRRHPWGLDVFERSELPVSGQMEVWDSGVVVFEPAQPSHTDIILSCAVHGDETAPIEICDRLIEAIRAGSIVPKNRVMFLIANPAAINSGTRFVEENMNRLFSGAHSQGSGLSNKERIRAKQLEGYVTKFFDKTPAERGRLHYDLHTAIRDSKHEKFAVYPFPHEKPYKREQVQLLAAMGVETILLHEGPTTTFSYYSARTHGADAFTVELGKVRPFGQNPTENFAACEQTLTSLIASEAVDLPAFDPKQQNIYQVLRSINRTVEDFTLNFPDDVANFTDFPLGYELARDGDTRYQVEQEGEAIIFPNAKVALGQRALITVVPADLAQQHWVDS